MRMRMRAATMMMKTERRLREGAWGSVLDVSK